MKMTSQEIAEVIAEIEIEIVEEGEGV